MWKSQKRQPERRSPEVSARRRTRRSGPSFFDRLRAAVRKRLSAFVRWLGLAFLFLLLVLNEMRGLAEQVMNGQWKATPPGDADVKFPTAQIILMMVGLVVALRNATREVRNRRKDARELSKAATALSGALSMIFDCRVDVAVFHRLGQEFSCVGGSDPNRFYRQTWSVGQPPIVPSIPKHFQRVADERLRTVQTLSYRQYARRNKGRVDGKLLRFEQWYDVQGIRTLVLYPVKNEAQHVTGLLVIYSEEVLPPLSPTDEADIELFLRTQEILFEPD